MSGGLAFWSIKCIVITKVIDVNRFTFSDKNDLIFEFLKSKDYSGFKLNWGLGMACLKIISVAILRKIFEVSFIINSGQIYIFGD